MNIHNSKILIIDFGSQLTQLIARRIRELSVYSEIHSSDLTEEFVRKFNPQGIILSGGPSSVYEENAPRIPDFIFELNIPMLGVCYGMQAMANQLGGEVSNSHIREFGYAEIYNTQTELFKGITDGSNNNGEYMQVWMSHGDKVTKLPAGFEIIATTPTCPIAAMANLNKNYYGVQFHPEVTHTPQGIELFRRFVLNICKITPSWNMPNYMTEQLHAIKEKIGSSKVILGLSGGVDSTVAAVLINKAIGDQLTCIFIDTGLLRLNEANQVMDNYKELFHLNIIKIDASERFYGELAGVTDPEAKRKIIGRLFVELFQEYAATQHDAKFLAQGTIYPDVIESASAKTKKAHNIKSHHNVGGLPDTLNLELLEPLRELFKDEVRKLGLTLGISEKLVYRHPFPGPGLGVRILGEVKPEFVQLLQQADNIFIEELYNNDLYHKVSQAFVVFIPVKTVGVMGDGRTYDYLVSLRSVNTTDFMSATVSNIPFEILTKVANRIINEVKGINRVTYDISGKPPATIEWE